MGRPLTAGERIEAREVQVTRADLVRYAGASGDFNPIHWSDRQARELGLEGVIAHGMWTMGRACSVVTDWVGEGYRVSDCFARFTRPVKVPDDASGATVVFAGEVTEVGEAGATITIEATCEGQKVLGAAKVEVRHV